MFKSWRERKAKKKKAAPPMNGPSFEPKMMEEDESEEMPVMVLEVMDPSSDEIPKRMLTAGGVRLDAD